MVPDGWKLSTFGNHVDCLTGFAFKSKNYSNNPEDIRLLRGDNIEPSRLRWRDAKFWPAQEYEKLGKFQLRKGDFVIAMDRTWVSSGLKVAEVQHTDIPCLLVQRVARIRALSTLEQSLLRQYFSDNKFEQYVKSVQTATAVPHISPNHIKDFTFLLPPINEQKKIAKILSTWDKAITTTEKLLANSQQQKKSLIQQLLTGKNRFQEYDNEWSNYFLSQLFDFKKGKGLSKGTLASNGKKCILYGELYTRYGEVITHVVSRTAEKDGFTSKIGDILIPSSTTTTGIDLSNATAILEDQVLLGGDINVLRPKKKINSVFMAYLLTHIKKRDIASRAQGITIIHLYGSDLKTIKVFIPDSIIEQEKIVTVLSTFDNEIEILKQKLNNLKKEKKALMQQLLTGKCRVKTEAA